MKLRWILFAWLLATGNAFAAATYDGSMGTSGTLSGNFTVPQASGKTAGNNLFHSFTSFDVNSGESATFTGAATILNIIARITGGSFSTINGLIDSKTSMPSANFFLLNPAGVIFGSNASLNIGGAFHTSTADYLRMADQSQFFSTPQTGEVLSTAAPTAFGFLNAPTQGIVTSGSALTVGSGQTLSFSGAQVLVQAGSTLTAPSGTIDLVGVGSAGEFNIAAAAPDISSIATLSKVEISGASSLNASSASAGNVYIRSGQFVIDNASITNQTTAAGGSGTVDIVSSSLLVQNGSFLNLENSGTGGGASLNITSSGAISFDNSDIFQSTFNSGGAGNITISGDTLSFANGADIFANSSASGLGGNVTLTAVTDLTFDSISSVLLQSQSTATGAGSAGNLSITSPFITFKNGSFISSTSFGSGNGGSLAMNTIHLIDFDGSSITLQAQGSGAASSLTMNAENIRFAAGSVISSTTTGSGLGGDITMDASKAILFAGESSSGTDASRIFLQSKGGSGNAGTLNLAAEDIAIRDGATISTITSGTGRGGDANIIATNSLEFSGTGTFSGNSSRIYTATANSMAGGGSGGDLTIHSGTLTMQNGAEVVSEATGTGNAGNVAITATGAMTMDGTNFAGVATGISALSKPDSAVLTGTAKQAGLAGNITLNAPALAISNGAFISGSSVASTGVTSSSAGSVNLTITGATTLTGANPFGENSDGFGSGLYSRSVGSGGNAGNAGSITLTTGSLNLSDGGTINSSTNDTGNGGLITIN
ncbi:MAG: filamentous hemagglutinin N-terminal domain-containing protein, partial [Mariprofundales bacterium]